MAVKKLLRSRDLGPKIMPHRLIERGSTAPPESSAGRHRPRPANKPATKSWSASPDTQTPPPTATAGTPPCHQATRRDSACTKPPAPPTRTTPRNKEQHMRQRRRTWQTLLATTASLTVAAVALTGCGGTGHGSQERPEGRRRVLRGQGPHQLRLQPRRLRCREQEHRGVERRPPGGEGHVHRTAGLRGPAAPAAHPERPDQVGHLQRAEPRRRLDLRVRRQQVDHAAARGRDPHGQDDPRHRQRRDVPGHPGRRPVLHRRRAVLLPLGPAQGRRHRRPAQDLGRDEDRLQGHPGPPRSRGHVLLRRPVRQERGPHGQLLRGRGLRRRHVWTPTASPPSTPPRPRRA